MIQTAISNNQRSHVELSPDPVEETTDFSFGEKVKASDSLRNDAKKLVRRIYEHSPDGSVIKGTLKKVKNGYKGVFKIAHSGGNMIAQGIQRTADETLKVLEGQIWLKIRRWRKKRFQEQEV